MMRVQLRTWSRTAIAAALFGSSALGGCSDDPSVSTLLPSAFPGSSIDESFLASDGRGFNESDVEVSGLNVFRNVANNEAIITFIGEDAYGTSSLWAAFYDGSKLREPVEIRGADQLGAADPTRVSVLFLNTARFNGVNGGATSNGRARNGDAIITYIASDYDDPSSNDRDSNSRVYASYFDRSAASKDAKDGVVRGFTTTATTLDFDNVIPVDAANPHADPSVIATGFASDSLHGTHGFPSGDPILSGDPTSFVQILAYKAPTTIAATPILPRWSAIPFDLGQEGNAFVAQSGATAGLLGPAAGTLNPTDTVGSNIVVADGVVLSSAIGTDADGPGVDNIVTATVFSASATNTVLLGSNTTQYADITYLPAASEVYGPDHGVGGYYAILREDGFTGGANGERAGDTDLMVAQLDANGASRAIVEIDEFKGLVDTADADADGVFARNGISGAVVSGYSSVVVRDGGLIAVGFTQPITDASDADPASATVTLPASNSIHRVQVIQTNRPSSELQTSVLAAPIRVPALASTGATGSTPAPVYQPSTSAFAFQTGLLDGQARVYGGINESSDIEQTNPNAFFFRYTQYNDQSLSGEALNQVRLFTSGLSVTPGAAGAAPTATQLRGSIDSAAVQFPSGSSNSGSHDGWSLGDFQAVVVDNFEPAGGALTFFASNDNNVGDRTLAGAYNSIRLYVWNGSTSTLVSSNAGPGLRQYAGGLEARVTNDRIHLFFNEQNGDGTSGVSLASRSWSKTLVAAPALENAPAFLNLQSQGAFHSFEVLVGNKRVGVAMMLGEHMYYNETRSDAAHYRIEDGLSNPTLVDNDSNVELDFAEIARNDGPNELSRSMFIFGKYIGHADPRLMIRVRD